MVDLSNKNLSDQGAARAIQFIYLLNEYASSVFISRYAHIECIVYFLGLRALLTETKVESEDVSKQKWNLCQL